MAVSISTQTANGVAVIVAEDSVTGSVSIAVNHATLYGRMADALENLAANVASIKTTLEGMSANVSQINSNTAAYTSNVSTIRTSITNMDANVSVIRTNSTTMATLASGSGMHIVSPYESFGAVSLYRLYAEQGEILNTRNDVSDAKEEQAVSAINSTITKVEPFREF